jgi:hypothetical protein
MKKINLLLFLTFAIILAWLKFLHHELWRDEWQAWLIATDTNSILEMLQHLTKEGHPPLWYLWLRGWNFGFSSLYIPLASENIIQLAHFTIIVPVFYILFVKFKLPVWAKIGIGFSYFLFFEYGVINRGYSFFILFTFLLSHFATKEINVKKNLIFTSVLLFLLGMTEIYGLFASIAFALFFTFDDLTNKKIDRKTFIFGGVLILAGTITVGSVLMAPENINDYTFNQLGDLNFTLFASAFQGLLANTFLTGFIPSVHKGITSWGIITSILCLSIIGVYFYKENKKVFYSYLLFFGIIYLFTSLFYLGGYRHWGIHFIFVIAMLNIISVNLKNLSAKIFTSFIGLCLFFQVVHNIKIVERERTELFSNAILAGKFIKEKLPANTPIFAVNKFFSTPVIGYSGRKFRSFPDGEEFSFFNIRERMYIPHVNDLKFQKEKLKAHEIYVISYKRLDLRGYPGMVPIINFSGKNIREENYYLYRF